MVGTDERSLRVNLGEEEEGMIVLGEGVEDRILAVGPPRAVKKVNGAPPVLVLGEEDYEDEEDEDEDEDVILEAGPAIPYNAKGGEGDNEDVKTLGVSSGSGSRR